MRKKEKKKDDRIGVAIGLARGQMTFEAVQLKITGFGINEEGGYN